MIQLVIYGILSLFVLLIVSMAAASLLTGKSVAHIFAELRATFIYNLIGADSLLDDILSRKMNKIDPIMKPGKIAIITGGTRGIGTEVIKLLLKCDMKVIMGCRKIATGKIVETQIRDQGITTGNLQVYQLDTSSLESVHGFADAIKNDYSHVNYLINNAGIMFAPYLESVDGYESQFATNYLGHFLLTHLLLPLIKLGGTEDEFSRIINVSSCVYVHGNFDFEDINRKNMYVSSEAYAQSKLAQIYFTTYLNNLLQTENAKVQVHAVHPGVVNTNLFELTLLKRYAEWFMKLLFKEPIQGAYPIVYATISPKLEQQGGTYITNCRVQALSPIAKDKKVEEKLFNFTKELVSVTQFGKE